MFWYESLKFFKTLKINLLQKALCANTVYFICETEMVHLRHILFIYLLIYLFIYLLINQFNVYHICTEKSNLNLRIVILDESSYSIL